MPDPLPPDTTIAELAAQGFTHLEARCRCKTAHIPFGLLPGHPKRLTIGDLYLRLRCRDCEHTVEPGSLRGCKPGPDPGYGGAGATWGMRPPEP